MPPPRLVADVVVGIIVFTDCDVVVPSSPAVKPVKNGVRRVPHWLLTEVPITLAWVCCPEGALPGTS